MQRTRGSGRASRQLWRFRWSRVGVVEVAGEQQILCGNDNQRSNGKSNGNSNGKGNGNSKGKVSDRCLALVLPLYTGVRPMHSTWDVCLTCVGQM
jgi:hypothetical protein